MGKDNHQIPGGLRSTDKSELQAQNVDWRYLLENESDLEKESDLVWRDLFANSFSMTDTPSCSPSKSPPTNLPTSSPVDDAPIVSDQDISTVGMLIAGINGQTSNPNETVDELRVRLSETFASSDGLDLARNLIMSNDFFKQLNDDSSALMRSDLCVGFGLNSPTSMASSDVKTCICGASDLPFLHCAARLEQELLVHLAQRAPESRKLKPKEESYKHLGSLEYSAQEQRETGQTYKYLRLLETEERLLQASCPFNVEGVSAQGKPSIPSLLGAILGKSVSVLQNGGDLCFGVSCTIVKFEHGVASIGIPGCISIDPRNRLTSTSVESRRAAAKKISIGIVGQVCFIANDQDKEWASFDELS